jgi:methylmalonyl-CoA mutase
VEEAVLQEFERIAERGGVLGAMETGYQRGKIQEESMLYEHQKHDGTLPIIGVNTFRNPKGCEARRDRAGPFHRRRKAIAAPPGRLPRRNAAARRRHWQPAAGRHRQRQRVRLMDAVRVCSLGQITTALFEVGGQYRAICNPPSASTRKGTG